MASGSDLNSFYVLMVSMQSRGSVFALPQGWIALGESGLDILRVV